MNNNIIDVNPSELKAVVSDAVSRGETVRITVVGNSMYPFLRSGIDSAELSRADSIKRNDVLFYVRCDGTCVLHRCVGIKDGEYVMCGDNQTRREYGIKREQILAAARVFYRNRRSVVTEKTAWYKVYMLLWCTLFSVRPFMCAVLKVIIKVKRKFKRS